MRNESNIFDICKIIDGKKYQFMGLYPYKEDLKLDLQRIHNKYGYSLKFEQDSLKTMKVWRR